MDNAAVKNPIQGRTIAFARLAVALLSLIVASIGIFVSWRANRPSVSVYAVVGDENGSEFLWVKISNRGATTTVQKFGYICNREEDNLVDFWQPKGIRKLMPLRLERNSSYEFIIGEDELSFFPNRLEDSVIGFGASLATGEPVWFSGGAALDFFERHK